MSEITYQDENIQAAITPKRADILDGLRRGQLIEQAIQDPEDDLLRQAAKELVYPDVIAGTEKCEIVYKDKTLPWPLPFDLFIHLPGELGDRWVEAVYELNPTWALGYQDEAKKKTSESTSPD